MNFVSSLIQEFKLGQRSSYVSDYFSFVEYAKQVNNRIVAYELSSINDRIQLQNNIINLSPALPLGDTSLYPGEL